MKKIFNKKIKKLLFFLVFIGISSFLLLLNFKDNKKIDIAFADTTDNVYGYAWSDNIGWISFNNCTNPASCLPPPAYGVKINNADGKFEGYAWSDNIGWIYFGPNNGTVQINNAPGNPKNWPEFDRVSGDITGWAYILSLGSEGWVSLDGVSINNGNFEGFAWNNNDTGHGIGWISFNSDSDGSAPPAYKVFYNNPPSAGNLTAPNLSESDACDFGVLTAFLEWNFIDPDEDIGDTQKAYRIVFDDVGNPATPAFDSGYCEGPFHGNCLIDGDASKFPIHSAVALNYNTQYSWQVWVWDSQYFISAVANSPVLNTPAHERPEVPDFDYFPTSPSAGENILFNSFGSEYYTTGNTTAPCDDAHCDYIWSATPATGDNLTPDGATTIINFMSASSIVTNSVKLRVIDLDGCGCEREKTISVKKKLPKWIEAK